MPCVILWKGHLAPRRIRDAACASVDIAPTLLDLLQIRCVNHFTGSSIAGTPDPDRAVHLVQPYNGTYLAVVKGYTKYVQGVRSLEEHLFDLRQDPHEAVDRVAELRGTDRYHELKGEIRRIGLNQQLLDRNRIWPR